MANKRLFSSIFRREPRANALNEAGGAAYAMDPKHALAQVAATGTFGNVYYASAQAQLDELRGLIDQVNDNEFLAKLAVYAREKAFMKDLPAALLVALSTRDTKLMHQVFDRVVDNGRVLRTVFQMVRSGQFGRKSLASSMQRAFQRWLNEASVSKLLSASIGNDPSLRDVLRLARPTPKDNQRRALFGWLTDKEVSKWAPAAEADLPAELRTLIAYRQAEGEDAQAQLVADLPARWDLLADVASGPAVWKALARRMGPQALRMNLNTLLRHQVLSDPEMVDFVAARLSDAEAIRRSRQFPYQYLAAYLNVSSEIPDKIRQALNQAAEIACGNIPVLPGPVLIGVDTSGSMSSPVSGFRGHGATSRMRCVDVAALFAAAVLRKNPDSVVVPFDTQAYDVSMDPADTILSLAKRLAKFGGGGTDCSIPLRVANERYKRRAFAGVVLVSDNESWVYANRAFAMSPDGGTGVMREWLKFEKHQRQLGVPQPKLICIDIQPYTTAQVPERANILNIGGFSDAVFQVVASFLADDSARFVAEVEAIEL